MIEVKLGPFFAIMDRLCTLSEGMRGRHAENVQDFKEDAFLNDTWRLFVKNKFRDLPEHLEQFGARVTMVSVQDALDTLELPYTTWGEVVNLIEGVRITLGPVDKPEGGGFPRRGDM